MAVIRGGAGDDNLHSDSSGGGEHWLHGEEGDDSHFVMSSRVRTHAEGGPGDDVFGWEGTDADIPTWADGGPGNDRMRARAAKGHDTLSGGDGDDMIDAFDRRGDTVTCGPGFDGLTGDTADFTDPACEPAPTGPRVDETLARDAKNVKRALGRTSLRVLATRCLTITSVARWPGTYKAKMSARSGSRWRRIAIATRRADAPSRYRLKLRLTSAGRALARRSQSLPIRVEIAYTIPFSAGGTRARPYVRLVGVTVPAAL